MRESRCEYGQTTATRRCSQRNGCMTWTIREWVVEGHDVTMSYRYVCDFVTFVVLELFQSQDAPECQTFPLSRLMARKIARQG